MDMNGWIILSDSLIFTLKSYVIKKKKYINTYNMSKQILGILLRFYLLSKNYLLSFIWLGLKFLTRIVIIIITQTKGKFSSGNN